MPLRISRVGHCSGNLVLKGQKTQLGMRCLIQCTRTYAGTILIRAQRTSADLQEQITKKISISIDWARGLRHPTHLCVPAMKDARICCPYDLNFRSNIFAIEHHVLAAPANDFLVKAAYLQKIRAILTGHAVAKVTPEARIPGDDQLLLLAGQRFALQRVDNVRIVEAKHHGIVDLQAATS